MLFTAPSVVAVEAFLLVSVVRFALLFGGRVVDDGVELAVVVGVGGVVPVGRRVVLPPGQAVHAVCWQKMRRLLWH